MKTPGKAPRILIEVKTRVPLDEDDITMYEDINS